jgi:hypothetical protein
MSRYKEIGLIMIACNLIYCYLVEIYTHSGGTRWRSWLIHYATSRKVMGFSLT